MSKIEELAERCAACGDPCPVPYGHGSDGRAYCASCWCAWYNTNERAPIPIIEAMRPGKATP